MSKRYIRVYEGPKDLYAQNSPLIIKAHALTKDETTGAIIAQLKLQNVTDKTITFVKVSIKPFDALKNPLPEEKFEYKELSVNEYEVFGAKTPLILKNSSVCYFDIVVIGVAFDDGTIWTSKDEKWEPDAQIAKQTDNAWTYKTAFERMNSADSEESFKNSADMFKTISGFKDADALANSCLNSAEVCRKDTIYATAILQMKSNSISEYEAALKAFYTISGWKDADEQINACKKKIEEIKEKEEADRLERERQAEQKRIADEKAAKKRKKIAAIVTPTVVACIAFVIVLTTVIIPNQQYKEALGKHSDSIKAATVGDTIKFGHYEQDNNSSNGKEEIEWIVLAKDGDKVLVISKYALDCQGYNLSYTSVTWETCSLRKWMNGTFLNAAFNSGEQRLIQKSTVTADKNPTYSTSPGNNTTDKVFLLSITEVNKYFSSVEARKCAPTDYAKAQGAYASSSYSTGGKATCWWWLRSPGNGSRSDAGVGDDGFVNDHGYYVLVEGFDTVRPALWISLE